MTSRASSGPGLALTKKTAQAGCALLALAAGLAQGQTSIEEAIAARNRGAIFESAELLGRSGAAAPAAVRVEQAINAYYLGRYQQARGILAGVLADPAAGESLKNRAVAWVVRINRAQINRLDRKPFHLNAALGLGADNNANNAIDSQVLDDFVALPDPGAPQRQDDTYSFYRIAASHAAQPAEPANRGGYPFAWRWTNSLSHYGRRFNDVDAWNAQYTRLASALAFEKHRQWAGSLSLSILDYRLDSDRLLSFGSVALSYKRLMRPVNLGLQAAFQRLDYARAAWSARTGNRGRVQVFVEGAVTPRHSLRAGLEPQRFRANSRSGSYRGYRAHLSHGWKGGAWRLYSRLLYEKNEYEESSAFDEYEEYEEPNAINATEDIEPGNADERRDKRLRLAVNLVRSLTPRLDLSLNAQYLRSDSNDRLRDLSKRQVDLSVRYRL